MNIRRGSIINKSKSTFSREIVPRNINVRYNNNRNRMIKSWIKKFWIRLFISIILFILILTIKKINIKSSNYFIDFIKHEINKEIDVHKLYGNSIEIVKNIKKKSERALEVINLDTNTSQSFIKPMDGDIVSYFQRETDSDGELQTHGIILKGEEGKDIIASQEGVVLDIGHHNIDKYYIIVKHRGELLSVYKNLKNPLVKKNQKINKGQVIGTSAGELEFEIWHNKQLVNPLLYIDTNI